MNASYSRPSFPSDTNLLVDACIATVREAAGLDDDAVLPLLPPLPVVAPRREVAMFTKSDVARATAVTVQTRDHALARAETARSPKSATKARRARWPLALCGFVAGAFACAAVLASPVGRRPDVAHATSSVRTSATHAAHATVAFFAALRG